MVSRATLAVLFGLFIVPGNAQVQLPPIDVEFKVHQNVFPSNGGNGNLDFIETTNWYGAAHFLISQHFAIGGFYSRNFRGASKYVNNDNSQYFRDNEMLVKGIEFRISTGRAKSWRKYMTISYSKLEVVEDNVDYRLAAKSNAIGANFGIMRKIGNRFYLTVIELGIKKISDNIFWVNANDQVVLDAKMGLLYNIGRKK